MLDRRAARFGLGTPGAARRDPARSSPTRLDAGRDLRGRSLGPQPGRAL